MTVRIHPWIRKIPGHGVEQEVVVAVRDLHIWTIASGFVSLTAHIVLRTGEDIKTGRQNLERLLRSEYGIVHTTLQVDSSADDVSSTAGMLCDHEH